MKNGLKALFASLLVLSGESQAGQAASFPSSFPKSGKVLWYTTPGTAWAKHYLPVGNGYLAAMVPGGTTYEDMTVNIEDLWNGGPFQSSDYNGGNPSVSDSSTIHTSMQSIRTSIFNSSTGTISNEEFDVITSPVIDYGSYASPGRLAVSMTGNTTSGASSNFIRWLDLDEGVVRSQWNVGKAQINRETFCSHPARACTQLTTSNTQSSLSLTYTFVGQSDIPVPSVTCFDNSTLLIRGQPWGPGMDYEILARIQSDPPNLAKCSSVAPVGGGSANATIGITGATSSWMTWVGGTNFDQDAGDAAHNFTFAGPDPHADLLSNLNSLSKRSVSSILNEHIDDITTTLTTKAPFQLDLGQKVDLTKPTDQLYAEYGVDTGNPYLEWLAFHLGRYLLWGSARGKLPANLQGKWARDGFNPWGADYHSNINIQMNYWSAEPTGLDVTGSLFDYFEKNWAPRGAETAQLLYNISRGWVVHNEMNIFGFTGMKGVGGTAQWADYPEANAWMMLHVWDHFDYTHDVAWFKAQGWPLLKGVASFHLDKLIDDLHFNDGTLVVAPCNSPEQQPITFGCAHAQQLIWMLFNAIEKGFAASGDTDTTFLEEIQAKKAKMDKGLHIGSWGQLQEWKFDMDSETDTHRHLSHLIGLYPGYAISNFAGQTNNTKQEILNAAEISLIHRGNGTGPDADAGWEKVWRAASWAQLGNASEFYHELTYALQRDFGPNLFSLYNPGDPDPIFQIDANLGYPGAVVNALLQAPDVPSLNTPLTITLLPAVPAAWNTGSFKGMRARGGISIDLAWRNGKPTSGVITVDSSAPSRPVVVLWQGKQIAQFTTGPGKSTALKF